MSLNGYSTRYSKPYPLPIIKPHQEVERSIKTTKEDLRTVVHGLPFQRLPKAMIRRMVASVDENNNQLPRPGNPVLSNHSPNDIIVGGPKLECNLLAFEFGTYAQAFDVTSNTIRGRTLGSIILDRTGNANNSYHLLSLKTGRIFTEVPRNITPLPITDIAIARLEQIEKTKDNP